MIESELKTLCEQDYSIREIANIMDKGYSTIRHWLKKYNLKTKFDRDGREPTCILCGSTDKKNFYGRKKGKCKNCLNGHLTEKNRAKKKRAIEYKGGKCQHCSYDKCPDAFDFHHVDPLIKEDLIMRIKCWEKQKKELDKCILLCSNCHREEHFRLRRITEFV